ncbi:MAG: oxygenase MpaB family protein [Actinomycetota bacterium]|nr:oxygenase MpaB family protein [Actinomycetota bacterium]MED5233307.1 oxygenase MpaB family protein [Actinomycetota bacterium]MEE3353646.1 oxygenase MpaB family protein [Actinomycetota bacterium]
MNGWRQRVTGAAEGLFSHAPDPLASTFDHPGDPGLFGPGSVTWQVMCDCSTFVGGVRALLVQAAHPEVAAGVGDHSSYRSDPLGRLSRTAAYVTATAYGSLPEVDDAVAIVRRLHGPVSGTSHRGLAYSAAEPGMAAWVHNALVDSFLVAHRTYGSTPMSDADADAYVAEQVRLGERMGADPLPDTTTDLTRWLVDHPSLGPSPAGADAVRFLAGPPLDSPVRLAYRIIHDAAAATVPTPVLDVLGIRRQPGAILRGRLLIRTLRAALGASPAWAAALERCGEPRPPGVRFRNAPGTSR